MKSHHSNNQSRPRTAPRLVGSDLASDCKRDNSRQQFTHHATAEKPVNQRVEFLYQEQKAVSQRSVNKQSMSKHSVEQQRSESGQAAADDIRLPDDGHQGGTERLSMEQLERDWATPEMMQCVNLGEQVSLSRSYSTHSSSGSSDQRSTSRGSYRRTFTDAIPEDQSDSSTESPQYANVDPLGVKQSSASSGSSDVTIYANVNPLEIKQIGNSPHSTGDAVFSDNPAADYRPAGGKLSGGMTRQNSVPTASEIINEINKQLGEARPRGRANSAPQKPPRLRRKETDIDSAIATTGEEVDQQAVISKLQARRPSRHMEYVNKKSYEPDMRRRIQSDTSNTGDNNDVIDSSCHHEKITPVPRRRSVISPTGLPLNTPEHSSTATSQSSQHSHLPVESTCPDTSSSNIAPKASPRCKSGNLTTVVKPATVQ